MLTPAHQAVLYSSGGRLLHSWSAPTATEVAVHEDYVVLLERGRLDVENAVMGRHVKAIPIQIGAYGLDVDSGIAVYARRNVVHAVLLSTGRDVAFAKGAEPDRGRHAGSARPGLLVGHVRAQDERPDRPSRVRAARRAAREAGLTNTTDGPELHWVK